MPTTAATTSAFDLPRTFRNPLPFDLLPFFSWGGRAYEFFFTLSETRTIYGKFDFTEETHPISMKETTEIDGFKSVAVGDLNGDGMMDVAAASTISNDVTIFFGNGDGTLQLAGQIPIDGGDPSVILARDVNDDGKLDLVVVNAFSTVAVLYGNGNGTFQNSEYFAAGFGLRSLSVADVNGDGTLEIVTADELFDEVSVLLRQ